MASVLRKFLRMSIRGIHEGLAPYARSLELPLHIICVT